MADPVTDPAFFRLLSGYGVPKRIIQTLSSHYTLPDPYPLNNPPREIAGNQWIYLFGPTGTGKSTYAAYLMALFLRARSRLGEAKLEIERRLDDETYTLKGSGLQDHPFYRYVRVTELLRLMKADFDSSERSGQQLFSRCLDASLLVLDDLTTQPSHWELTQLDLLIDRRYGEELKTIITSNQPLSRLERVLGSDRIPGRIGEIARVRRMKETYR